MTKILYMENIEGNYIKEFDAVVTKNKDGYICLDQTAFYPMGGGQPSDIGYIQWDNIKSEVKEVIKKGDAVKHILHGEKPSIGTKVYAVLDWNRRYNHMKMHTAQHILSGIIFDDYNARTVGNQIHADYSRVDFHPVNFENRDLEIIEKKFNEILLAFKLNYNLKRISTVLISLTPFNDLSIPHIVFLIISVGKSVNIISFPLTLMLIFSIFYLFSIIFFIILITLLKFSSYV